MTVRDHFQTQAGHCKALGSPFYARFVRACAQHLQPETAVERHVLSWPGNPATDALALRFAGALRFLVLTERAPELAALYPPNGDGALSATDFERIRATLVTHAPTVLGFLAGPVQTNEVRRCFALSAGFLSLAHRTGLPLSLYEVGASAGLNLLWDRLRYECRAWTWGNPQAPLRLETEWEGPTPPFDRLSVSARRACDLHPIDVTTDDGKARLLAYVWPDQGPRLARVHTAIALFRDSGLSVEAGSAAAWLADALPAKADGVVRVVYHSVMWQYLSAAEQAAVATLVAERGAASTPRSPLVWLRLEPGAMEAPGAALTATSWPGGQEQVLAQADYHGRWVHWAG